MISKKISIIMMLSIVAVSTGVYGVSQTQPTMMVSGLGQSYDFTFEEKVNRAGLVFVGEIVETGVKIFPEDLMGTDEEGGVEYVVRHDEIPRSEVTIKITEMIKDDVGLKSDLVTVYDRQVNGEIGRSDGEVTLYKYRDSIEYHIGDKGIFMIENDRGLWLTGYASFYPIIEGQQTTISELDKVFNREPIDVESAKSTARALAERTQ